MSDSFYYSAPVDEREVDVVDASYEWVDFVVLVEKIRCVAKGSCAVDVAGD